MAIVVTGGKGLIGRALDEGGLVFTPFDKEEGDLSRDHLTLATMLSPGDSVIHLAGIMDHSLDAARASIAMTLNVIEACTIADVRRLIFASSLAAEPEKYKLGYHSYYTAAKRSGEALVRAWVEAGRPPPRFGFSLRLGAFGYPAEPASCRMSSAALMRAFNGALNAAVPGHYVENVNDGAG